MRRLQKTRRSSSKNNDKKNKKQAEINKACQDYTNECEIFIEKAKETKEFLLEEKLFEESSFYQIDIFIAYGEKFIDQIRRRIIEDEVIPHKEKTFSVFEEHTEWIVKGKAGVLVELGVRVVIVEDQFGFILNHMVPQNQTDEKIAVPIIEETKELFPEFNGCSFDQGFYSLENQKHLEEIIDDVVMPKKGKLSKERKKIEKSDEFRAKKRKHSAVESAINALEVHGLDRCPDKGLPALLRYTAVATISRNFQKIGAYLQKKKRAERLKVKRAA